MTVWTIRIALVFFAASVIGRIWKRDQTSVDSVSRVLWTIATLIYILHVICAFHFVHDWSHAAAVQHTAEQSEQFIGLRFGGGIWFNHLFTLLCLTETAWWWINPISYQTRNNWLNIGIFGYFAFIAINGAIVFVTGPVRWIAIIMTTILTGNLLLKCWNRAVRKQNVESE